MSDQPLVSIIIPCWNFAGFLPEALDSAFRQDWPNIEVILVTVKDDAPTISVFDKYKTSYQQLVLLTVPIAGLAKTRNAGTKIAHGEFLVFLDADDVLEPNFVSQTMDTIQTNDAYVYVDAILFGYKTGTRRSKLFNAQQLLYGNYIAATSLIRASIFKQEQGFAEELDGIGYEDWDFYLRLAEDGIFGSYLAKPLFGYRQHQESMVTRSSKTSIATKMIRKRHPKLFGWRYYVTYYVLVAGSIIGLRKNHV